MLGIAEIDLTGPDIPMSDMVDMQYRIFLQYLVSNIILLVGRVGQFGHLTILQDIEQGAYC